jgi:imidazole glycerol-phosphate synthase subunit HisH
VIAIVDYGMGNLKSVTNAFAKLGVDVTITSNRAVLEGARAMVLPGVGAFGKCMENLHALGLSDFVEDWIGSDRLYMGICLGMQILFQSSEEAPGVKGLGIIGGRVLRFRGDMKVPHMGWNSVAFVQESEMFEGIRDGEFFYFVHSYYCRPDDPVTATSTTYGIDFASSIQRGNLFACQFHPEKSQKVGLRMLQNFVDLVERQSP